MEAKKQNTIVIIVMVVVLVMVFSNNLGRKKREKEQSLIESAKRDFGRSGQFDSVYAENDTVRFFKDHSFVGMSVIDSDAESDTILSYKGDSLVGMSVTVQK